MRYCWGFTKKAGDNIQIKFNLNENITGVSRFIQKAKIYTNETDMIRLVFPKIRMYLCNSSIGDSDSIYVEYPVASGQEWEEAIFDFTDKRIPAELNAIGGLDHILLVFAPEDLVTEGTEYFFDDLR